MINEGNDNMALSKRQLDLLSSITKTVEKFLASAANNDSGSSNGKTSSGGTRHRRRSEDAEKMKTQIRAARKKGVPAKTLAEKYGVSTAYVYMIK